jgi:hypothetical protein
MPENTDTTAAQFPSHALIQHAFLGRTPERHPVTPMFKEHETAVGLPEEYRVPAVRSPR